jgi:hypothetical protein
MAVLWMLTERFAGAVIRHHLKMPSCMEPEHPLDFLKGFPPPRRSSFDSYTLVHLYFTLAPMTVPRLKYARR